MTVGVQRPRTPFHRYLSGTDLRDRLSRAVDNSAGRHGDPIAFFTRDRNRNPGRPEGAVMDLGTATDALIAVLGTVTAALAYLEAREHRNHETRNPNDSDD